MSRYIYSIFNYNFTSNDILLVPKDKDPNYDLINTFHPNSYAEIITNPHLSMWFLFGNKYYNKHTTILFIDPWRSSDYNYCIDGHYCIMRRNGNCDKHHNCDIGICKICRQEITENFFTKRA